MTDQETGDAAHARYTKEQLTASARYTPYRDLLAALLDDTASYSEQQVVQIINRYMKRKV